MKKPFLLILGSIALAGMLLTGCAKTESTMTPQEQASFGKYGQPMPAAAKAYMQQHQAQMRPGGGAPPAAKH